MYKFDINESGYYIGYSKNGVVPMNEEYNLNNKPTAYHKHNGTGWILDNARKRTDEINIELDALYSEKSALLIKIDNNELWYGEGDSDYAKYKEEYDVEKVRIKTKITELTSELKTLTEDDAAESESLTE